MKKIVTWLLHEIKQVWMASAFFFAGFSTIGVLKYLFLAEYHIHGVKFSKALVFALVVGKVVVVLDKTPFGNRFRQHAVALDVFYRSLIYGFMTFLVLSLEKLWHLTSETGTLASGWAALLDQADHNRFFATNLCLFLCFVGYNLIAELSRHMGRDAFLRFLFARDGRKTV